MTEHVLAIDIGGTKIAVALVSSTGEIIASTVVPTAQSPDPDEVFLGAAQAVEHVIGSYGGTSGVLRVGISSAGPINGPAGTVSPVNIPAWRAFPVSQHVEQVLARFGFASDVALAGDGHSFALGEHWLGAGRDVDSMVGLVLSTGVGGGAVINNRLFAGTTGNSVHLGHISVNAWGPECVCGCHGCVEWYARGPALVSAARLRGWTGGDDARALTRDASSGDQIALSVIDYGMRALAAGIASTATQLDVTTFVLGGGVSRAGDVVFAPLRRHLRDFATLDFVRDLEVRPALLENAGLLGAAALALSLPRTDTSGP
jgi:glucokinase